MGKMFYKRWCERKGYVIGDEPEHSLQAIKKFRATAAPRPQVKRSERKVKASAKVAALSGDQMRGFRSKPSPVKEGSDDVRPRRRDHATPLMKSQMPAPRQGYDALREQMKGFNIGKTHGRPRPDLKEDAPAPALKSASESRPQILKDKRRRRKRGAAQRKALKGMLTGRRLAEAELSF